MVMELEDVKKQVISMIKSISELDLSIRIEAMKFLKCCALNYGLIMPEENLNNIKIDSTTNDRQVNNNILSSTVKCENAKETNIITKVNSIIKTESKQIDYEIEKKKVNSILDESNNNKNATNKNEVQIITTKEKCISKKAINYKDDALESMSNACMVNIEKPNSTCTIGQNVGSDKICLRITDKEKESNCIENEIFKCPSCLLICDNKPALLQHFTSHGKAPMSCRLCRSNFSRVLHFWKHQKKKECKMSLLRCAECGEKFKYRRHYLKHVLGHNDNNCRYCDEKFSTWVLYKHHLKEKHPDIKMERDLIPCKFCAMSFRRHLGLYNHYQVEHSKGKFVCLSCGLLLPTKEKYKEHVQVHESEKSWKCKICKMKFYRRQQLLFHVAVHKSGTYKCLTCDITVTSKVDLCKHKKDGHEVKGLEPKFECEICHKNFKKKIVLKNHMATHSKEKKYYCKHCVKNFRTLDALQKHQKRKSHFEKAKIILPESKYEKVYEDKLICESCGKQYKTQRELTWHLRVHKSIYECDECGKTFTLKVNLTKHIRLHRDKVCVVCELCGNTFNQMSALNEHILMKHSDVRNAECEVCKKKFKRKSELNRHMRIHEQKRPFVCFCGTAFKQSSHLQTHYKTFHEKNTEHQNGLIPQENYGGGGNEVFAATMVDRRAKPMYSNGDQGTLLTLTPIEPESSYRDANSFDGMQVDGNMENNNYGLRYGQSEMDPMNVAYEDLNFEASQADKRELVFSSPAIDLSMVTISEVVQNDMSLPGHRDISESVETFTKLPDDASNLQLVNLSEHIVQEYLLNLS